MTPSGGAPPGGVAPAQPVPTQPIPAQPAPDRARTVTSFDADWLFFRGDPAGAAQPNFADGAWSAVDVPHDWSIEGPFLENAPSLGNGGYAPSGVGSYRKHFSLPAELSGRRVFIEFDGVMANSTVSINGVELGTRPNGYVGFRYELTEQVAFGGADNVLAVRSDTTPQPASRWYTGAGIYRHVRLITTDPVHVDEHATFVTTPEVSAAAATVRVQTTVVNQGASARSVSLHAVVRAPNGLALPAAQSAPQSIAPGARADFTLDIAVDAPLLWSTTAPNLYQLVANVQAGDAKLDDDVVTFGIRSIEFDPEAGFLLNGQSLKLKGLALHHDVSGLGAAVPMRAWQRRLAQLKNLGANALRTAHNPFAPEVLELCDRMGILVLDEFFDAWTGHKPTVTADYGGPLFAEWGTRDLADTVLRDRNHPSVVLYSLGNEIRDALASRINTANQLIDITRGIDPTRPITQSLFRPMISGDYPGAMLDLLDVFGANYRIAEVVEAIALAPGKAGVVTEIAPDTANWATVLATPGLTGFFLWAGFDYLGEAGGLFPVIGSSFGIMDRMGTLKDAGYAFQAIWSDRPAQRPATGTAASRIVVTADHSALLTDPNDVSYVQAKIADANGNLIDTASNPVTFGVTGPGTLVAVDSGSVGNEPFRGNLRNAFQGLAFAIVRATGPGTITVTASTPGLAGGSASIESAEGVFVPCSGSCD